jgi:hypothetical protein
VLVDDDVGEAVRRQQRRQHVTFMPRKRRRPFRRSQRLAHRLARRARGLGHAPFGDPRAEDHACIGCAHARDLGRCRTGIGREDHAEHRQHHVGARVGKGQRRRGARDERGLQSSRGRLLAGDLEEPGSGIDARDAGAALRRQ